MFKYFSLLLFAGSFAHQQAAQTIEKNLRKEWKEYVNGSYVTLDENLISLKTIYLSVEVAQYSNADFGITSTKPFFVFFNGKLSGEYQGRKLFKLDSIAMVHNTTSITIGIHQDDINTRDLYTFLKLPNQQSIADSNEAKPPTYFKDFVIVAGLLIIVLFLATVKLNPKLASDYFSVTKIFSLREAEDAQANARLTSSSNFQFYIVCSLLLSFYLIIVFHHLPQQYLLPLFFKVSNFWNSIWHWLRFSAIILSIFLVKIFLIYALSRLFGMRGLARIHFFNWIRLLLTIVGVSATGLFVYFILRGQHPETFVWFLSIIIATLIGWIVLVFLKLNGKTDHSTFHLFSYICATEIIPLLITIKVLFQ